MLNLGKNDVAMSGVLIGLMSLAVGSLAASPARMSGGVTVSTNGATAPAKEIDVTGELMSRATKVRTEIGVGSELRSDDTLKTENAVASGLTSDDMTAETESAADNAAEKEWTTGALNVGVRIITVTRIAGKEGTSDDTNVTTEIGGRIVLP